MENLLKKEETGVQRIKNFIRGNKILNFIFETIHFLFHVWLYYLAFSIIISDNISGFDALFLGMMVFLAVLQLIILLIVNPDNKKSKLKNFYAKQEIFEKSYRERGYYYNNPDLHLKTIVL